MNWDAIGAVSEGLGAIGMFVTLGFLAVQIRSARREAQRAFRRNREQLAREMFVHQSGNEWLNQVICKMLTAFDTPRRGRFVEELVERGGLAEHEAMAGAAWIYSWWMFNAQQIAHIEELSPGERMEFDANVRFGYRSAPTSHWYETQKRLLNPDAVRYVDNLLAQPR